MIRPRSKAWNEPQGPIEWVEVPRGGARRFLVGMASMHEARIDGPDLILDGTVYPHLYAAGDAWVELAVQAVSIINDMQATIDRLVEERRQ